MKKFKRLTEIFAFLWILFFGNLLVSIAQTAPDNIFTLPAGTKIRLRMDNEINSKASSVGDTFTATVSESVLVRGTEILPVGAVIEGKIIKVTPASFGRKDGNFEVKFETLRLRNGAKRVIDAELVSVNSQKSSNFFSTVAIIGGTAIGALIGAVTDSGKGALIGAGLGAGAGTSAALLKKGKEERIKANEEFGIRLNKDVTLPVEDY